VDRNINSIFYWWPIIKDLGVPVPKTTLIPYEGTLFLDTQNSKEFDEYKSFVNKVGDVADKYGYPVFIRCGGLSNKFDWEDSCFVADRQSLLYHISNIMEAVLMVEGIRLDFDGIAVREFLHLETKFEAFGGKMPIGKEFRFFARNGEYECHHPYWPPTAIYLPSIDNWFEELKKLQQLEDDELKLLKSYTATISQALDAGPLESPKWWSIDFCKTVNGEWYITDLGTGPESFHWKLCPHALPDMQRYPDPEDSEKLAQILGPTGREERRKHLREKYKLDLDLD